MKNSKANNRRAYIMLAPAIVIILAVVVYPLLRSIWFSFFDVKLNQSIGRASFVGFDNYTYYFEAKYNSFWHSIAFTSIFTLITLVIEVLIGILMAVIINKSINKMNAVKGVLLLPFAIPVSVSALMWKFLFDVDAGLLSNLFEKLHLINHASVMLTTHSGLTFSSVFADVWKTTPILIVLFLIGLHHIDKSIYDVADMDGASKTTRFFKITLPLLKPTILIAVLIKIIDGFRTFDLVYLLTGGAKNTDTISTLAHSTIFSDGKLGRGSALAVITFLLITIISLIYIKLIGSQILLGKEQGCNNEK